METIARESYFNSNLAADIDNFRSRYFETDFKNGISAVYPAMELYSYEQNLFVLIAESDAVPFKPKWTMRPDYTSFDMYGSVIHWPLILFVNDIYSIEDYKNLDTVLIPPKDLISKLIRDKVPKDEIMHINKFTPIQGISLFQRNPLDSTEQNKIQAKNVIEDLNTENKDENEKSEKSDVIEEAVDSFELSSDDIENKYVDLNKTPINASSVFFYIESFNVPQKYGYDYVLTNDVGADFKRVTWNSEKCFGGHSNLDNVLKEGNKIKIKYLIVKEDNDEI